VKTTVYFLPTLGVVRIVPRGGKVSERTTIFGKGTEFLGVNSLAFFFFQFRYVVT